MGVKLIKFIHVWDKIARYIPVLDIIKCIACKRRWAEYLRQSENFRYLAMSSSIELRILVLSGTGIGNAIESTPLIIAIRHIWPKAYLAVVIPSVGLFDNMPGVDFIANSIQQLEKEKFDHTFISWNASISAVKGLCNLGQIHHTEEGTGIICSKPEREYNMDMLRRLGYQGLTPKPYVYVQKPQIQIPQGSLIISLVPGGTKLYKWRYKQWPYFDKLAELLLEKYRDAQIYILGTIQDEVPPKIFDSSRVCDLRGSLTLPETAYVIKKSSLVIGNDCGPMHITGATETASIVIFGPTCEIKNASADKFISAVFDVPCRPCQYNRKILLCKNPLCMNMLTADIVLAEVRKFQC